MPEEVKEEIRIVLDKEDKKQLKWNIIKFIIWIILLVLSWQYIQWHPAERVSVFSWFDVLWQKIEVVWHNTFSWNWNLLEQKYSLEKYYQELINLAEWNDCVSAEDYESLEAFLNSLKKEETNNLWKVLPEYVKSAYIFEAIVKNEECDW